MPKAYNPQDQYFHRAKELGYRARSVFKLEEIQNKFHILKPGGDVLDLGAAPGSWLQYAVKITGPNSQLIGLDLKSITPITPNIKTLAADIFSEEAEGWIRTSHPERFPVIISDLAPNTSGQSDVDHYRSIELSERVIELAEKFLAPRGCVIIKVFQGPDFDQFIKNLKTKFSQVNIFKPNACRDRSFEVYLIIKR